MQSIIRAPIEDHTREYFHDSKIVDLLIYSITHRAPSTSCYTSRSALETDMPYLATESFEPTRITKMARLEHQGRITSVCRYEWL